jgi:hydroxymethylbilane synthase
MTKTIRLGTRGSTLARWQTDHVRGLLEAAWPRVHFEVKIITTRGDQVLDTPLPLVGGKGVFTAELEAELRSGAIDLAVHSLKDLPTDSPQGLAVGAIPPRADPHDVLISRSRYTLDTLPHGASVGTSSTRRAAQLLHLRPDLKLIDIRGNVETRIRKALDPSGPYDAIVLAMAGLERLGYLENISEVLPFDVMLPAPGQGAMGVQCRDDRESLDLLRPITDADTQSAVIAERAFLAGLGGGCAVPIATYAELHGQGQLYLRGRVCARDGSEQIDVNRAAPASAGYALGSELAKEALAQGAAVILETTV